MIKKPFSVEYTVNSISWKIFHRYETYELAKSKTKNLSRFFGINNIAEIRVVFYSRFEGVLQSITMFKVKKNTQLNFKIDWRKEGF